MATETVGVHRALLSQRSRRRCRQRHPQRRRLQPSPRSRLAEDDFARRPPRATSDLRNPISPQTSFLTGDYLGEFDVDAETNRVLDLAFEMTRAALGLADDFANGIIARQIVELARAGERNLDLLCEDALKKLRGALFGD
jgi:hypothetical protein